MLQHPVVTRFAPSPSGALHLGNARTALFNFLLARRYGGRCVLRIEDSDAARSQESFVEALCADLAWLGLSWDEGPDRGGPHAPYRQSQRLAVYAPFFARLEHEGLAYPCYCTPLELELANRAQRAAGRPPRYAGTCRQLSDAERTERAARGLTPSLRLRVPPGRRIEFQDLVHGPQSFASDDIGDFTVRREDGSAAFLFANAIDDALMQVSLVLRGADHLSNTPRQRLLLDALELPAPQYAHVSLLTGTDGTPLSKRHGATSVGELREAGYSAAAVCNHLFRLGHSTASHGLLTLEQMTEVFDAGHLQRSSAHLDPEQLLHWQREWVHSLSVQEARAWLEPLLPAGWPHGQLDAFIAAVRPNVVLAQDARQWWDVVFGEALSFEEGALLAVREAGAEFFARAAEALGQQRVAPDGGAAADATIAAPPDLLGAVRRATGRHGAALFRPLRAALTGRLHGPELAPLLAAMPPERVRSRLLAARAPA